MLIWWNNVESNDKFLPQKIIPMIGQALISIIVINITWDIWNENNNSNIWVTFIKSKHRLILGT